MCMNLYFKMHLMLEKLNKCMHLIYILEQKYLEKNDIPVLIFELEAIRVLKIHTCKVVYFVPRKVYISELHEDIIMI